ncbi:MAG: endonuclease/exonuclease/phosphatase family metal-dependent hydrolase [Psychromonas sp.]
MKDKKRYSLIGFILKLLSIITIVSLLFAYLSPFVHPGTLWFIPFFGLIYPIIIGCALILLIFNLIRRSRMTLLLIIVIVCGGKLHFRQFVFSSKEPTKTENNLKLLSYNVRLFDLYNWSVNGKNENRKNILSYIVEETPDVMCFQEFYDKKRNLNFKTMTALQASFKGIYKHTKYSTRNNGGQKFGIAIVSKFPIVNRGEVNLPSQNNEKSHNYCIYVDIKKGKDTLRIYNVHLQSIKFKKDDYALFNEMGEPIPNQSKVIESVIKKLSNAYPERASQAQAIVEDTRYSPYKVVICGDFNDTPLSYTYNQFSSRYVDAFRNSSSGIGTTYIGKIPAGRIDFIFHSNALFSSNFSIQKQEYSDHRAISCTIGL